MKNALLSEGIFLRFNNTRIYMRG